MVAVHLALHVLLAAKASMLKVGKVYINFIEL